MITTNRKGGVLRAKGNSVFQMFQEREVITLILGVVVFVFALRQRELLCQIQSWPLLFTSFALMLTSLACSVIEGVGWEPFFNFIQHLCSALSALVLAVWCWRTFSASEVRE